MQVADRASRPALLQDGRKAPCWARSFPPLPSPRSRAKAWRSSVDWRVDEKTTVDLAGKDGSGYFGFADARLGSVGMTRQIGDNWTVGMRYGLLREDGSVAGIRTSGAFGGRTGAETQFGNIAVEGKVTKGTILFGSMSRGVTEAARPGTGSLLAGLSGVRTDAFLIGAEMTRLWAKSDRLTVTASSPFRAQGVRLTLAVPDREVADGQVEYRSQDVDLEPRGREGRLQAVYPHRRRRGHFCCNRRVSAY